MNLLPCRAALWQGLPISGNGCAVFDREKIEHRVTEIERRVIAEAIVRVGANVSEHQSMKLSAFEWVITAPFGTPVEPDVWMMLTGLSPSVATCWRTFPEPSTRSNGVPVEIIAWRRADDDHLRQGRAMRA